MVLLVIPLKILTGISWLLRAHKERRALKVQQAHRETLDRKVRKVTLDRKVLKEI